MEQDRAALTALRANIVACRAEQQTAVLATNVLAAAAGKPCGLIFLDPPYGQNLVVRAIDRLRLMGWIAADALVVAEIGRDEALPELGTLLAERAHGAARVTVFRIAAGAIANGPEAPVCDASSRKG